MIFFLKIFVKILIGKHPTEMIDLHLLIVGCRLSVVGSLHQFLHCTIIEIINKSPHSMVSRCMWNMWILSNIKTDFNCFDWTMFKVLICLLLIVAIIQSNKIIKPKNSSHCSENPLISEWFFSSGCGSFVKFSILNWCIQTANNETNTLQQHHQE